MSTFARISSFDKRFHEQLGRLRDCIETLPGESREQLLFAAHRAEEQHEQMQATCRQIDGMVADIGLTVAHAKFHTEVCRRQRRAIVRVGHDAM